MCASEAVPNSNPIDLDQLEAQLRRKWSIPGGGAAPPSPCSASVRSERARHIRRQTSARAGREVPEGHSERAADFRFQLMHGASKAVGRQPFCKGRPPQGTRDRLSLGRLSERGARALCWDDDLSFCGIDWRVDHQLPGIGRTGMTSTDLPGKIVK